MAAVGGVWMIGRGELGRRWRGVLAMGILFGLAGAFALTAAMGARRAATSWDRFAAATVSPEVVVNAPTLGAGPGALAAARATPGVRAAAGLHWLPVALGGIQGEPPRAFVALDEAFGRDVYRPRRLAGRLADQSRIEEVMVNRFLAETGNVEVGDRLPAVGLGPGLQPSDSVDQQLVVVGVVEGTIEVSDSADQPVVYLTAAFRQRWLEAIAAPWGASLSDGQVTTPVLVDVAADADPGEVAEAVAAASPAGTSAADVGLLDPNVETTIGYTAGAYAVLAAGAAVATAVAGAQSMRRLVQPRAEEHRVWAALGATPAERTVAMATPALAAAGLAVAVAALGVVLASPLVPTGLPRRIEVDPGVWIDPAVLLAGLALLAGVLGAAAVLSAAAVQGPAGRTPPLAGPAWLGLGSPARALGMRAALGWGMDAATRRRARSAIAAAALGAVGTTAVVLVVASSGTVLDSPRAWGFGFDRVVVLGDLTATDPLEVHAAVSDDPDVDGLSVVRVGLGALEGEPIELQEIEPSRGSALPVLLDGRAPIAPDEVALGPLSLTDHGLAIGDTVAVADGAPPARIVGTAAVPAQEDGDHGAVAWLPDGAFARLGVETSGDYLYLTAAPGVPVERLDRIPGASRPVRPPILANLRHVGAAPHLLAGFLAVLALTSLTHALLLAVRTRRRELAVLRSLGFVRGQVHRTVMWQAATTALAGLALGAPAGVIVGTWTWRRLAGSLGTLDDVIVPVGILAVVALGGLAAALLVALDAARRAGRVRAAEALRTE